MTAKIIAVANQKGGTGKTTLAMTLSGTLGRRGHRVLVVDADPQGSATRWAASAPDSTPFPAAVSGLSAAGAKVHREVKKYVEDYDFIVIDCPPAADSPVPMSALMIADLALVPVIPSPPDLWAAVGIRQVIANVRESINENLDARLVANMCQTNTEVAREALEVMQDFGIPVAQTKLHHRTAYRQAAAFGGTVHALGSKAAGAIVEIDEFTDEVLALIATSRVTAVATTILTEETNHGPTVDA